MKVIFMGTPVFAVPALAALIGSEHRVVAVYSQPPRPAGRGMKLTPSPVHQVAQTNNIPVYTPENLKSGDVQAAFVNLKADIAVVAAYGLLLPPSVLNGTRFGCINIHPSDLPRWRGAAPIQRTLMAGDRETACCIIQLEAGLDTGPIHLREPFTIPLEMDAGGLHDVMAKIGAEQVLHVLKNLSGENPSTPQPQATEGVTYAAKITKEERAIDWSRPAEMLLAQIRGLAPAPAATASLNGETVKVFRALVEAGDISKAAGIALDNQLLINTGNGTALRLTELQRPGRTRASAAEILQGFTLEAGAQC